MGLINEEHRAQEEYKEVLPSGDEQETPKIYSKGTLYAERYEIINLIGQGALGAVYLALDREENREIALKVLRFSNSQSSELLKRFNRFLALCEEFNHRNLVRVYSHGQWQGECYLVREYVNGKSLEEIISKRKKANRSFSLEEVINIFSEVAKGLSFAEEKTFHGSLTPANILITDETVKITDLALARILQPSQFSSLQIYYGEGYFYLAPEYDRSGAIIDQRADLYAAAIIAYEMLTGNLPRQPLTPPSQLNSNISSGLDTVFLKALALPYQDRTKSLDHFIKQLKSFSGMENLEEDFNWKQISSIEISPREEKGEKTNTGKLRLTKAIEKQLEAYSTRSQNKEGVKKENDAPKPLALPPSPLPLIKPAWKKSLILDSHSFSKKIPKFLIHWPWMVVGLVLTLAVFLWVDHEPKEILSEKPVEIPQIKLEDPLKPLMKVAKVKRGLLSMKIIEEDLYKGTVGKDRSIDDLKGLSRKSKGIYDSNSKDRAFSFKGKSKTPALAAFGMKGNSRCPNGMIFIPPGSFTYGNPSKDRDFLERPSQVILVNGFCMDQYEWPNQKGVLPKNQVSFLEAQATCESEGKRLCSEYEWEKVCKGPKQSMYPYGNRYYANTCNTRLLSGKSGELKTSGQFEACTNDFKVFDLSGNLAEWTTGKLESSQKDRIVRGGSYRSSSWAARCTQRRNQMPQYKNASLGFRCCSSSQ